MQNTLPVIITYSSIGWMLANATVWTKWSTKRLKSQRIESSFMHRVIYIGNFVLRNKNRNFSAFWLVNISRLLFTWILRDGLHKIKLSRQSENDGNDIMVWASNTYSILCPSTKIEWLLAVHLSAENGKHSRASDQRNMNAPNVRMKWSLI